MAFGMLARGSELSEQMLLIEVANPGEVDVQVQSSLIRLPDGHTIVLLEPTGDVSLPHVLTTGRSCRVWTPLDDVKQTIRQHGLHGEVKLTPMCRDGVGEVYKGRPKTIEI